MQSFDCTSQLKCIPSISFIKTVVFNNDDNDNVQRSTINVPLLLDLQHGS